MAHLFCYAGMRAFWAISSLDFNSLQNSLGMVTFIEATLALICSYTHLYNIKWLHLLDVYKLVDKTVIN